VADSGNACIRSVSLDNGEMLELIAIYVGVLDKVLVRTLVLGPQEKYRRSLVNAANQEPQWVQKQKHSFQIQFGA
jgi:hypothetical protein